MDNTRPLPMPLQPRPSIRRPILKPSSSDLVVTAPPVRRQSDTDALQARRDAAPLHITMPMRPSLSTQSRVSQRSVQFSPQSFEAYEMPSRTPQTVVSPGLPTYPLLRTPDAPHATLFGFKTKFRPLWLLGMGNAGLTLFSMGEVLIQRAVWPVAAYDGLNPNGPTVLPGGAPGHGHAFGGRTNAIIAGCIMMGAGVGAAVTSSVMFMQDGRRLNRAQNPDNPDYRRTMRYFAAHQTGIGILAVHKFLIEIYRHQLPPFAAWAVAFPGGFAQALFSVSQAQSFSSSELANGKMPLRHRASVSGAARALIASYIVLGAMQSTPNISAYGREAVRMIAAVATSVSFALPLASARLAGPAADIPVGGQRYRGDWSAMQAFCVYVIGRLTGTISSFWLSRSRWPAPPLIAPKAVDTPAMQQGVTLLLSRTFRGLPPPLPTLTPDLDETAAAAVLMTISFIMTTYAFAQFHRDAAPPLLLARAYVAAATASVILGLMFRTLQEFSKSHAAFEYAWIAAPFGFTAQALAFWSISEMFAASETSRGNLPIRHRYQVIEGCRFAGGMLWYLWLSENAILGFPPVARQLTIWAATSATILGFALPNADAMRAARGATPAREIANPFDQ